MGPVTLRINAEVTALCQAGLARWRAGAAAAQLSISAQLFALSAVIGVLLGVDTSAFAERKAALA